MDKLTHTDDKGKAVMVDVGAKANQIRIAKASGHIILHRKLSDLLKTICLKKAMC